MNTNNNVVNNDNNLNVVNVDELNKSIDRLCNEISKLSLILSSRFTISNTSSTSSTGSTGSTGSTDSVAGKSINETIVLYSLSDDSLIKDLNLDENNNIVVRTCRSNIKSKRKLVNRHKGSTVTIYREYIVSNPHNISTKIIDVLMNKTKLIQDTYYGHIIINKQDLNDVIESYDKTLKSVDCNSICLTTKQYILNNMIDELINNIKHETK